MELGAPKRISLVASHPVSVSGFARAASSRPIRIVALVARRHGRGVRAETCARSARGPEVPPPELETNHSHASAAR